jgi:hypothetical protein
MTTAFFRSCALAGALAAVFSFAVPAAAQDDDFRKGMSARADKKWSDAAAAMRSAIAMDPKESTRKVRRRIGGLPVPGSGDEYLPHFFLGEALSNQGDCTGALNAWDESERQGVARKIGTNVRIVVDGFAKCESQGFLPSPKFGEELRAARAAYAAAGEALGALSQDLKTHPGAAVDAAAHTTARGQVATAAERLAAGEKTRRAQEITEARTLSETAVRQLQVLRASVAEFVKVADVFAGRLKTAESELQAAEGSARDVDSMFSSSPISIAPGDRLNVDRARAVQLLAAARDRLRSAGRSSSDVEVAEATKTIQDALATLTRVKAGFEALTGKAVTDEISRLQRSGTDGFVRVDTRLRSLRDTLSKQPDAAVSGDLDKLETTISRARRTFENASKGRDLRLIRNSAGAPTQFEIQLEELARRLGINQPLVVPPTLLAAAQAQFQGRYAEALEAMPVESIDQVPIALRIHAHLIRAAALFSLYEVSGPRDESLRARAREEAARARGLDAAFQPSAAFSPRFIRFYQAASAAPLQ